jgi:hypothetical protein
MKFSRIHRTQGKPETPAIFGGSMMLARQSPPAK